MVKRTRNKLPERVGLGEADFHLEWFSGTGRGGQHRNKHQNCCRVTHIATGIQAQGTGSRSRERNKRDALAVCRARVVELYREDAERYRATDERVRTYHAERNEVLDHASKTRLPYKQVLDAKGLDTLIRARALAINSGEAGEDGGF